METNETIKPIPRNSHSIDWEERHFQACLAILSGVMANPRNTETLTVGIKPVVKKADMLIALLKEREQYRTETQI